MACDNIMVDLETLGTTADSVILSIGAAKFDLLTGEVQDDAFYTAVSLQSNIDWKRYMSASTLTWWLGQADAAKTAVFSDKSAIPFELMLEQFHAWAQPPTPRQLEYKVWANGPEFDTAILSHAFKEVGMEPPWKYWNSRCVRTYKSLAPAVKVERTGTHHNALDDVLHQIKLVCAIHKELTK